MTDTHVPPQALEAEESILGAMMLSPSACDTATEHLDGTEFYRDSHARIFHAAAQLTGRGEPVDAITLTDALGASGDLDNVGGRVRLYELAALVPATANIRHYVEIVKDMATLRNLIRAGAEISRLGWERPGDAAGLLDQAEQIVYQLGDNRHNTGTFDPGVRKVVERIHRLYENPQELIGVPSGYTALDQLTQGFQPGQLAIIAARPSMGKSALAINMALKMVGQGVPVAIFSLEMSRDEIVDRALAIGANLSGDKIKNPRKLTPDELQRVDDAAARLEAAPLFVRDEGAFTPTDIRAQTRRLKAKVPNLGVVFVDYLQLMSTGAHDANNRVMEVSAISRALKVTAKDLQVPIVALSQLSRAVEQRQDKRPILSDLRESGSIEQDADLVAFIYRHSYYQPPDERGTNDWAELILAKHRNGPTDTVRLVWLPDRAQFGNPAPPRLAGDMGVAA